MPYITQRRRVEIDAHVGEPIATVGELNYAITKLVLGYIRLQPKWNYELYNGVIGALEAAKQEFYRRVVVPYEDAKIAENGDVYTT